MSSTRDYLDGQIASLEGQLRALKTARNRHTMICYIPSEILAEILADVVWYDHNHYPEFHVVSWKKHVELTSVCTLWRDVALGFPSYWRCIPIRASRHIEEMLARSKQAPLSIRIEDNDASSPYEALDENLLAIILQPTRLAQLHLSGPPALHDSFLQRLPPDLPLLQSLALDASSGLTSLPPCLLSTPLPSLQHLQLCRCTIPCESLQETGLPLFSELLSLKLVDVFPALPFYSILPLLSSKKLKRLEISKSLQEHSPFRHDNEPEITLPHLEECSISGSLGPIPRLLSHLAFPDSTLLDIYVETLGATVEYASAYEILGRLFNICGVSGARSRPFSTMTFTREEFDTQLCFFKSAELDSIHLKPDMGYYDLRLCITGWIDPAQFLSETQILLLPELQKFYLDWPEDESTEHEDEPTEDYGQPSERDWRSFFQRHPKIQEIHIIGSNDPDPVLRSIEPEDTGIASGTIFMGQTQRRSNTEPETSTTELHLPSLRKIRFEDAYPDLSPHDLPFMNTLATIYITRVEQGYPAPRITLSNCTCDGGPRTLVYCYRRCENREQDIQSILEDSVRDQIGFVPRTNLTVDSTSDWKGSLEYDMDEEGGESE